MSEQLWVREGAPSAEDLFLDTLEDLRRRSDLRAGEYDMIQSSLLVRRLVVDQKPLYAAVNRTYRLQIRFEVSVLETFVFSPASRGSIWLMGPFVDPWVVRTVEELRPESRTEVGDLPSETRQVKLEAFLAVEVASEGGVESPRSATVLDVIRLYAHEFGGAHFGMEKDPNPLLAEAAAKSELFLRQTMAGIGRVVYRALEPLAYAAVLAKRPHPFGADRTRSIFGST